MPSQYGQFSVCLFPEELVILKLLKNADLMSMGSSLTEQSDFHFLHDASDLKKK